MAKDMNWFWIIVAIIAIYLIYNYTTKTTTTPGACPVNPTVVSVITDALTPGNSVTTTNYYRFTANGVTTYLSSTSPTSQGTVDVLMTNNSAAGYIAKIHTGLPVNCGVNYLTDSLYLNTTPTVTIYSNNGLSQLTNSAGGATNETQGGAGASYNWRIHLQGVALKDTGQMEVIAELSTPANISSVSLTGGTPIAVPNGYSRQLTNGYAAAWLIPEVNGNSAVDHNLQVSAATNYIISRNGSGAAVYITIYTLQPFVETDGTFNPGNNAFNSLNVGKMTGVTTYNFGMGA